LAGSSEEKFNCLKCRDKQVIIYRVHRDTDWVEKPGFETLVPESMVPESDFYAMKVCGPENAWQWRETYSKRCDCVKRQRKDKLMKASDITAEFKRLSFQNFVTEGKPSVVKDTLECALEYYQEFDEIRSERANSIALLGQPGAGKTHLLTAVSNNLLSEKEVSVLYFPYVEGFNDLKDDFDKLEAKLDRMKKVDVLFLDDLFKPVNVPTREGRIRKPRATEWQIEQTYAVVNYRYLNHKPILVSSELTVGELVDVDEALGTRIYQMCQDFTVVIKGDRKLLNHRLAGLYDV
jgi:DNA replication protein DnaC